MKTWTWIVRPFGPWSPLPRIRRRPLKVPSSSTSGMGASPHGTQCAVLQNKSGHRRTNCTLEPGCGAFGWGSGSRCGYGVVVGCYSQFEGFRELRDLLIRRSPQLFRCVVGEPLGAHHSAR